MLRYPFPLPKNLLAAAPRHIAPNVCVYFNERMSSESYLSFSDLRVTIANLGLKWLL